MLTYILFALGFLFLIKGADLLVSGASALARRLGVSSLVIGLTVVSFGTSAPELVVSMVAAVQGSSSIALGNVFGSNVANVLLILGAAALVCPLAVGRGTVWKEIPMSMLAVGLLAVVGNDLLIDGRAFSEVSRIDGLVLLTMFVVFIYYTFSISKAKSSAEKEREAAAKNSPAKMPAAERSLAITLAMVGLGMTGLVVGGQWVVSGATSLAKVLGVSDGVIAVTIVALGTSLPELVTSIVAALKKDVDIAVGNAVGSNIFNVFLVLGASAVVRPLKFLPAMNFDALMAIIASALLFLIMFIGKRHVLERRQGIVFLLLYFSYIGYLAIQEALL